MAKPLTTEAELREAFPKMSGRLVRLLLRLIEVPAVKVTGYRAELDDAVR